MVRVRRRFAALLLTSAATLLTAGCSGLRGGLHAGAVNGDANSCAAVLPVAHKAVGNRGVLVAVHPLAKGQAAQIIRAAGQTPSPPRSPTTSPPHASDTPSTASPSPSTSTSPGTPRACVVAYRGDYQVGQLPMAPQAHGRYAVAIVRVRHPEVSRLLVVDRLPPGV